MFWWTYLDFGKSVKSSAVDSITVGYRTSWTENTVALTVGITHEFPHLLQNRFLHDCHYGRYFECIHTRI